MLEKTLGKAIAKKLCGQSKKNKKWMIRKLEKKMDKIAKIKVFGRTRYILAWLFGEWMLYAWNRREYGEKAEMQPSK